MKSNYKFEPDYAVPPGATLKEAIEALSISQIDLAARTGLTEKTVSQIMNGTAPITYETADKLELVVGIPARFWNSREAQYRESLLRIQEAKKFEADKEWLGMIPVGELVERGFIPSTSDKAVLVRESLKFFQVSSVETWEKTWLEPQVQFRGSKAHADHPGFVAAWIRMGEIDAQKIECAPYNEQKFRESLDVIRGLIKEEWTVWFPKMRELCAAAGVAVVLVKEIPRASVSGVAKWVNKDKAVIMLSFKYKSEDQFWFSFFHEACHILKHSKKTVFYEDGSSSNSPEEIDADVFARDILIPSKYVGRFATLKSRVAVIAFAAEIGISPGIVVGRLQRDKILDQTWLNALKRKYVWS